MYQLIQKPRRSWLILALFMGACQPAAVRSTGFELNENTIEEAAFPSEYEAWNGHSKDESETAWYPGLFSNTRKFPFGSDTGECSLNRRPHIVGRPVSFTRNWPSAVYFANAGLVSISGRKGPDY